MSPRSLPAPAAVWQFPDWHFRHDFVVKTCPTTSDLTPHVWRLPYQPHRVVVYYRKIPSRNLFERGKNKLLGRRTPLYFASFIYQDPTHGETEVTREELCTAFKTLVGNWQTLLYNEWVWYEALERPYKDEGPCRNSNQSLEDYATRGERSLKRDVELADTYQRLLLAAEYFGQYLSYLSDLESSGQLPNGWTQYPGPIDLDNVCLKSTDRYLIYKGTKSLDDYAFRAARLLNNSDAHCSPANAALSKARALASRLLEYKGYSKEEISTILTMRPKSFFLPPKRRLWGLLPPKARESGGVLDPAYSAIGSGTKSTKTIAPTDVEADPPPY